MRSSSSRTFTRRCGISTRQFVPATKTGSWSRSALHRLRSNTEALELNLTKLLWGGLAACACAHVPAAWAASAPEWMRAQLSAPVPAHDEETDAVLLYSETELTVQATGKMKRLERRVYKILRANGESYGVVAKDFTPQNRVTSMQGWSIPAQGKDFQVKERDALETAITNIDGAELISDVRRKLMRIPASIPGSIIGYEVEQE